MRACLSFVLMSSALVGCSSVSTVSTTSNNDDEIATYAAQKNGTADAYEELGWSPTRNLTPDEQTTLDKRVMLKRLEAQMTDMREREQYFKMKPYLSSDDECIHFLSLPSYEERDHYALDRGIYFHANKFSPAIRDAVSRSDIILGMNKQAVLESWGEPIAVEVAGETSYGNERWRYIAFVSTPEGYQKEERIVIFEGGKVAGWQKN